MLAWWNISKSTTLDSVSKPVLKLFYDRHKGLKKNHTHTLLFFFFHFRVLRPHHLRTTLMSLSNQVAIVQQKEIPKQPLEFQYVVVGGEDGEVNVLVVIVQVVMVVGMMVATSVKKKEKQLGKERKKITLEIGSRLPWP